MKQTVQRLVDSWCNVIRSNGIAVLMAFFDTQPGLQDSDKERVDFSKSYLEDLRFLYKDSNNADKKVCYFEHYPSHLVVLIT